ncbi:precorrin-4/cobalt-precorrin-4 C11-methyltransferase [Maridesulfovibrio ferrireducens]|uniref:Precorrin-4/cobalt-precorrin-4 C11-methyltransferase n=1 Tax=Maridesulfovibrio ferrireducens TaxID=246191 RepID=A0A1G9BFK9_9BACT|nr:precorrin-4 C(11)-methyltransferase [Maridesulfovibrio ferrireducens]SDK38233.1 precorrin-4/cobalt-precorrin-4 C11-methyltransferase [Maridesulfovibrio ferrireducens]
MGKVYFIGAGPGDPELITVKGQRIIREAGLVLYAGSLVPESVIAEASPSARIENSAAMSLEETNCLMTLHALKGETVARVHTGDPSLYGAIQEQARLLKQSSIEYEIIPGVTSACAAAAASSASFTVPNGTQTLIITRMEGRTPVPQSESLEKLAVHGSAMAIYLSAGNPERIQEELIKGGMDIKTPVIIGYRIGWPEEKSVETTLGELAATAYKNGFKRQTIFLILPGKNAETESLLYDSGFSHLFRKGEV